MISKPGMLTNIRDTCGTDSVIIGDDSLLPIIGISDYYIKQRNTTLPLHNVLIVSDLTKKLLSMSRLTNLYPVNCEFSNVNFYVKEWKTGQPLIIGRHNGDLYVLPTLPELHFSHRFKSGSADIWHQHLGHPQFSNL